MFMKELAMCLWNTGAPGGTKSNMAKIFKSYILTPTHPQGHVMSVKCEEPIDELTVQVWLLYHNPNFKYCTLLHTCEPPDGRLNYPVFLGCLQISNILLNSPEFYMFKSQMCILHYVHLGQRSKMQYYI